MIATRFATLGRKLTIAVSINVWIAILLVNLAIYVAPVIWYAANPQRKLPVTISRALTEPSVTPWFIAAMVVSACALVFATPALAASAGRLVADRPSVRFVMWITVLSQIASGFGMVGLSVFRFPEHNLAHMIASSIFFLSQLNVTICFVFFKAMTWKRQRTEFDRVLAILFAMVVCIGILFVVLFLVKDMAPDAWYPTVYRIYIASEMVLISSFFLTFGIEVALIWRRIIKDGQVSPSS